MIGLVGAALHICWRAGSLHPLNNRLRRLFISRDDIQDPFVKKNLSDYSALTVFRLTYGIHAQTLADAKKIIGKAEARNVPLALVGLAGGRSISITLRSSIGNVPAESVLPFAA